MLIVAEGVLKHDNFVSVCLALARKLVQLCAFLLQLILNHLSLALEDFVSLFELLDELAHLLLL